MRRAAVALLGAAALACSPGERLGDGRAPERVPARAPAARPVEGVRGAGPTVRVGIAVDTPAVRVSAPAGFELRAVPGGVLARGAAAEAWLVERIAGTRASVRRPDGTRIGEYELPLRVIAPGDMVEIGGRQYRGQVLISARDERNLTAVNVVDLELYLRGVVPREMGRRPASEIEALKAQAVAARTYAIGNLGGRERQGFDFYATVLDQVYGGTADEDTIVTRAIAETAGEVVTHDGRPILAYYSSTCGGHTAAIEEAWPWRAALPYLRGVSDQVRGSDEFYCSSSNRFNWRTEWNREQLLAVLAETLAAHTRGRVSSVRDVERIEITGRSRAQRATIRLTADGQSHTLRADSVRWVLRPQPSAALLNSSRVYQLATRRERGSVQALTIEGGGWGHGVGMCQVGAMGRARAGHSYRQILQAYYHDTRIERLY
ncbi:MAG TPA: SpoIID/LytB domain-containing protein [Longimicrobiales bacterium]|nr:SpoIID/LytB domain-containing protein [Longimicrobiales bacterium]